MPHLHRPRPPVQNNGTVGFCVLAAAAARLGWARPPLALRGPHSTRNASHPVHPRMAQHLLTTPLPSVQVDVLEGHDNLSPINPSES